MKRNGWQDRAQASIFHSHKPPALKWHFEVCNMQRNKVGSYLTDCSWIMHYASAATHFKKNMWDWRFLLTVGMLRCQWTEFKITSQQLGSFFTSFWLSVVDFFSGQRSLSNTKLSCFLLFVTWLCGRLCTQFAISGSDAIRNQRLGQNSEVDFQFHWLLQ